jgi:hypothetical protein
MILASLADANVSLERLNRFMRQPDVENYRYSLEDAPKSSKSTASSATSSVAGTVGISVTGGTFFWEHPDARATRLKLRAGV